MPESTAPRWNQLIAIAVLVIALVAVFFVGQSVGGDDDPASGTNPTSSSTETFGVVTGGEAAVTGIPDQLTFRASISNTRGTTAAAMRATSDDVRAINAAARKTGVASHDIQTQGLSLQPKYQYLRSGGSKVVGYTSTQSVKFKVRKLTDAGKTIGAVATAAGNAASISGISLSISNQDELVAKARTAAVAKSKAAAAALAKAAGQRVGDLEYVEEVSPQETYYQKTALSAENFRGVYDSAAAVPIRPGKKQVSVTVKVRWALADQ